MAKQFYLLILLFFSAVSVSGQSTLREPEFKDPYNEHAQPPTFLGGDEAWAKYVENNMKYYRPEAPQVTWLSFTITLEGRIKNIRVDKTSGKKLDDEAIRVLKNTRGKWTPGRQFGRYCEMETMAYFKFKSW